MEMESNEWSIELVKFSHFDMHNIFERNDVLTE